jgi:hypothetical protein
MSMSKYPPGFAELAAAYQNTATHNDALHRRCTELTWATPPLAEHRRHVEHHQLGFGDAAFHALWACLLERAVEKFGRVRALEIGVFKGQVISLWSLVAQAHGWPIEITALGPLRGNPAPRWRLWHSLRLRLDRAYREQARNGNFYADEDYAGTIRRLFNQFNLNYSAVKFLKGYSTDPTLLAGLADQQFEIIYVDGDHTYEGATHDFTTFGPKVVPGGWLVADDAGCALPGTTFWKGHEAVSRAVEVLPAAGFRNVLNVGHNRVFERG